MSMHKLKRDDSEIDRVLNWAMGRRDSGETYHGLSYEEGLIDMLDWITGVTDEAPDEE